MSVIFSRTQRKRPPHSHYCTFTLLLSICLSSFSFCYSPSCISCILAPTVSSTMMGVDSVPHPDCANETPLFTRSNLPVSPADDRFFFGTGHPTQQYVPMSSLASSGIFDIKNEPEKEIEMTSRPRLSDTADSVNELEAVPETTQETVKMEQDKQGPKMLDVAAVMVTNTDGDAEVDEAAIQHALAAAAATWASGGTGGRRAMYSSVRTHAEVHHHRASYLERQRPDLDRRISHRSALLRCSSLQGEPQKTIRRTSVLFRSR